MEEVQETQGENEGGRDRFIPSSVTNLLQLREATEKALQEIYSAVKADSEDELSGRLAKVEKVVFNL